MSVENDFMLAFVAFHRDPAAQPVVSAAMRAWGEGEGDLAKYLREQPEIDECRLANWVGLLRGRLHHVDMDDTAAFATLFRSLFQARNRSAAQFFFDSLLANKSDVPAPGFLSFRRDRVHATGGLGQVWLAFDEVLQRRVALKEVRSDKAQYDELETRFLREARITGRLEHPNIVPVHQLVTAAPTQGGSSFYTMRFVEGRTLAAVAHSFHEQRRTGRFNRMEFNRLLDVFMKTCQAIAFAHSQKIIHRDLKPENIMVGQYGEAVVLDWGLAKEIRNQNAAPVAAAVGKTTEPTSTVDAIPETRAEPLPSMGALDEDDSATRPGSAIGTPVYMAPEQASGNIEAISERTDIFGLGGILFCILTDRPPHERRPEESVGIFLDRVATRPARRVRDVEPKAARTLDAICARAMAFHSSDRYSTADELAADVERWLAGEPVKGVRESFAVQSSRWVMRRQRGVLIAGGVGFVLLLLAAISWNHRSVSTKDVVQQQILDSRYAVQVFAKGLLRSAEKLAGDVRFLGESRSAYGLLEARRAGNARNLPEAKTRFDESLRTFLSRHRTLRRVALIDFQGAVPALAATLDTDDQAAPIVPESADESLRAAEHMRATLGRLGDDLVALDKIYLVADSSRTPSQIWPRARLAAPVIDDRKSLAGAIVIDAQFGVIEPKYAPKEEEENRERDTDWFLMNDAGTTLWSDPGRYFHEKDVPNGRPIQQVIPELAPMFQTGESPASELAIERSGQSAVAIYARSLDIPYFRPAPRLIIAASTPREQIVAASARRQSSMTNVAALVATISAAVALVVGTVVISIVRRAQRCFD